MTTFGFKGRYNRNQPTFFPLSSPVAKRPRARRKGKSRRGKERKRFLSFSPPFLSFSVRWREREKRKERGSLPFKGIFSHENEEEEEEEKAGCGDRCGQSVRSGGRGGGGRRGRGRGRGGGERVGRNYSLSQQSCAGEKAVS